MSIKFTAVINKEENWYVAHCLEFGVVSQGKTIEQAETKLQEAVELYLESCGVDDIPGSTGEVMFHPMAHRPELSRMANSKLQKSNKL